MKKKPGSTEQFALKEGDRIVLDNRTRNHRIAIEVRRDANGQVEVNITLLPPADETESENGN